MNKLADKVALITGASGGLGEATARHFSALGAKLILTDIKAEALTSVAESLPNALAVTQDVSDESGWDEAVKAAISAFGRLDILVNNAGVDFSIPLSTAIQKPIPQDNLPIPPYGTHNPTALCGRSICAITNSCPNTFRPFIATTSPGCHQPTSRLRTLTRCGTKPMPILAPLKTLELM